MDYRRLGNSGLLVSVIGLGTNQFGGKVNEQEVAKILRVATEQGVNFLDTANVYQKGKSEAAIGKALKGKRHDWIIATKVRHPLSDGGPNDGGSSRKHMFQEVEASLSRLKTDYIDLYQLHSWDENTPLTESMQALDDLVHAGKVRYVGASNFSAWQLTEANALARENGWTRFVSIQPHYHMFQRDIEKELIPACHYFNIGILPYFPLAGGFLTGKYQAAKAAPLGSRGENSPYVQQYFNDANFSKLEKLSKLAAGQKRSLSALAHAWLLAHPQVSSVISGVTKVSQLLENTSAFDWQLSAEQLNEIEKILE